MGLKQSLRVQRKDLQSRNGAETGAEGPEAGPSEPKPVLRVQWLDLRQPEGTADTGRGRKNRAQKGPDEQKNRPRGVRSL